MTKDMINSKKKGNHWENEFANWLLENNITKAYRNSSSGANHVKGDINNPLGINFEMKAVKKLNLLKAYEQSERDADKNHTIPYVVVHFDGMPQDKFLIVMNNFDWADLYKNSENVQPVKFIDDAANRTIKYLLQSTISALKKLLKQLEKCSPQY